MVNLVYVTIIVIGKLIIFIRRQEQTVYRCAMITGRHGEILFGFCVGKPIRSYIKKSNTWEFHDEWQIHHN